MSDITTRSAVDRLARLRARMRQLEAKEAELVDVLRRSNHDTVAGRRFVATITRSHREMVDRQGRRMRSVAPGRRSSEGRVPIATGEKEERWPTRDAQARAVLGPPLRLRRTAH